MSLLRLLPPSAIAVTGTIVLLQLAAFWRTLAFARQMRDLFNVSVAVVAHPDSPGTLAFRFEFPQGGRATARLVKATEAAMRTAHSVAQQLQSLKETTVDLVEQLEEHVTTIANLPVYLGLAGTFAGITLGVVQILLHGELSDESIHELLTGVLVAMFSSLVGVLLMITANAVVLPRAREIRNAHMSRYLLNVEGKAASVAVAVGDPSLQLKEEEQRLLERTRVLTESFEMLSQSIEPQRRLFESVQGFGLDEFEGINLQLRELAKHIRELQFGMSETVYSMQAHAAALRMGDVNIDSVARDVSTLPAILEVLRELAAKVQSLPANRTHHKVALSDPPDHAQAVSVGTSSVLVLRAVSFFVFSIAVVSFLTGMLAFPGSHFGAGLSFGGAVLAYEAVYVFVRHARAGSHRE